MRKQYTCPKESAEQRALVQYMALRPGLDARFFHVPNERTNETERMRLAAEGVKPGVPDNFIMQPFRRNGRAYYAVAIELKRAHASRSRVSPEQKKWIIELTAAGYWAVVAYGAREAIGTIEWAYGPP